MHHHASRALASDFQTVSSSSFIFIFNCSPHSTSLNYSNPLEDVSLYRALVDVDQWYCRFQSRFK